ncbi:unnamed protein product, partial [Meganyctiphanes norvegica]
MPPKMFNLPKNTFSAQRMSSTRKDYTPEQHHSTVQDIQHYFAIKGIRQTSIVNVSKAIKRPQDEISIQPTSNSVEPNPPATPLNVTKKKAKAIKRPRDPDEISIQLSSNSVTPSPSEEKIIMYGRSCNLPVTPLNAIKKKVKAIKRSQDPDDISIKSSSISVASSPSEEKIISYSRTCNPPAKPLNVIRQQVKGIKRPRDLDKRSIQPNSKREEHRQSSEKIIIYSKYCNPHVNPLSSNKSELLKSEDTNLAQTSEPVNSNGRLDMYQRDVDSSMYAVHNKSYNLLSHDGYVTRLKKKNCPSADDAGNNSVSLLPKSLDNLKYFNLINTSTSLKNPVNETAFTNATNALSVTVKTEPVLESVNLQWLDGSKPQLLELSNLQLLEMSKTQLLELSTPRMLKMSKPQLIELLKPRLLKFSKENLLELSKQRLLKLSTPQLLELLKPQLLELSKLKLLELSNPGLSKFSTPQLFELLKPELLESSKPQLLEWSKPLLLKMSKSQLIELLKPQLLELSKAQLLELSNPQSKPQLVELSKHQLLETSKSQSRTPLSQMDHMKNYKNISNFKMVSNHPILYSNTDKCYSDYLPGNKMVTISPIFNSNTNKGHLGNLPENSPMLNSGGNKGHTDNLQGNKSVPTFEMPKMKANSVMIAEP